MSSLSSVVPQSRNVSVLLAELLTASTDATRVWLRAEMDRTVDPMLNSIFNRFNNKLVGNTNLDRSVDGDHNTQVNQLDHVESSNLQLHHSVNVQPSTSFISSFNPHYRQPHSTGYEPEFDQEILAKVKRDEITLQNVKDTTPKLNQKMVDCVKQEVKEEEEDGQMIEIVEENEDGDAEAEIDSERIDNNQNKESSRAVRNTSMDTTPPHSIGQSQQIIRQSARIAKRKQINDEQPNEVDNRDNLEDTEEDDDDDNGSELEEEVTFRSIKRQSSPTTLSSTKPKQIITLTLRCPQCGLMFAKEKFKKHLKQRHSIRALRCLVKKCGQSFDNNRILNHHIAQSHPRTTHWHCGKCPKNYPTYKLLSIHNTKHHHLGQFQCSHPACTFTGEYRGKVGIHYASQHRTQTSKKCAHPGCQYQTPKASSLRDHQRVHLGLKPYRCKWPQCDYVATQKSATILHIRQKHLARKASSVQKKAPLDDPSNFLEVLHELL